MKIEIDADKIWAVLNNPVLDPQAQFFLEATRQIKGGESWKHEDSIEPSKKAGFSQEFELFHPFERINISFDRLNDSYIGIINLRLKDSSYLEGLTKKLKEFYGELWVPTDFSGCKGFLRDNRETVLSVSYLTGNPYYRSIHILNDGAEKMPFGTAEDFITQVSTLEQFTNNYVNEMLKLAAKSSGTTDRLPPEDFKLKFG